MGVSSVALWSLGPLARLGRAAVPVREPSGTILRTIVEHISHTVTPGDREGFEEGAPDAREASAEVRPADIAVPLARGRRDAGGRAAARRPGTSRGTVRAAGSARPARALCRRGR